MANKHKSLGSLFKAIADSIREKTGKSAEIVADDFPDAIAGIETSGGGVLEAVNITPTGEQIVVAPDYGVDGFSVVTVDGDVNLTSQNIAEGVTIYGVEGTLKVGASSTIPPEYEGYVDHAKLLYTGDYANMAIVEDNNYLAIVFMMEDFVVTEYNEATTEFKAQGWVSCSLTKAQDSWNFTDWRNTPSTGQNYVKNIRYSSAYWEYNGQVIWPVGMSGGGGEGSGGGSTFETSATGCIPEYDHGYATTELTNVFTTSATGANG